MIQPLAPRVCNFSSKHVISREMTQNQNAAERLDARQEMAFRDAGSRHLYVISEALPERIDEYFSHCISRNPKDLLTHVQRIHFVSERGSSSELYSALLDLFIGLGVHGLALRRAMLKRVSSQLDSAQRLFLNEALETGITERDVINDRGISILTSGYSGCDELVIIQREQGERKGDPLQQAMASIECSDLEEARAILEGSLYSDRTNLDQQKLLLEIYRKTGDKKHFMALYETFEGDSNPAYADWQALATHFGLT